MIATLKPINAGEWNKDLSYNETLYSISEFGSTWEVQDYEVTDKVRVINSLCTYGDYCGCLVQQTNFECLKELLETEHKDSEDEDFGWEECHQGYNRHLIAMSWEVWSSEDVQEFLGALEDYCVADEDKLCKLQLEAESEAWENWACSYFLSEMESFVESKSFDYVEIRPVFKLFEDYKVSDAVVFDVFQQATEKSNEYWVNESGGEMRINLERVFQAVTLSMITKALDADGVRF